MDNSQLPRVTNPPVVEPAVRLQGICKRFGDVQANQAVSLTIEKGTIHGIVGENGAGKSTLMSILYGLYHADAGQIFIDGKQILIDSSHEAIAAGIGMVHQHFMLISVFTVIENIVLGAEDGPIIEPSLARARKDLIRIANDYKLEIDPEALLGDLPVGVKQRVEILKALYRQARILILDEPTGVLTPQETDRLFEILRALREDGVTIVLITHKLREIMAITDNVTVMRAGQTVAERKTADTSPSELAELMVGRKVLLELDKQPQQLGSQVIQVENLTVTSANGVDALKQVSFKVHTGEILGVAGVSGNGQSELMDVLAGIVAPSSGSIVIDGHKVTAQTPVDPQLMRSYGVAHVPQDRHAQGLVMDFPAEDTLLLGHHHRFTTNKVLLDRTQIRNHAEQIMPEFDVRPPDPELASKNFSGGNQQKIVIAREVDANPRLFLVGQPTRGVDIGAIEAIHRRLLEMRNQDCAILLVSFELDEVMSLADRIIVLNAGRIVGEVESSKTNEQELGMMMAGIALN